MEQRLQIALLMMRLCSLMIERIRARAKSLKIKLESSERGLRCWLIHVVKCVQCDTNIITLVIRLTLG
jgi:hypothetical protein